MPEESIWPLEQHTKAKHELLRRYLAAWFAILGVQWNPKVVFLDGFAGPGVYANGEPGSPLVALSTLVNHSYFGRWDSTEFVFLFIEKDAERYSSLEREVERFWSAQPAGQPRNVRVRLFNDELAAVAEDIVAEARERNWRLAPTLAFIDPFGWSGVPLRLISELLSFEKCEVLFNFTFDSVNRFVGDERPGVTRSFAELFGTDESDEPEHHEAAALAGTERKYFLRDLYMHGLREIAGFTFVRSFELRDVERGRTAYFLMFGTRHPKGLQMIKEAMWALDPERGVRFSGFAGDQQMLFEPEPNVRPLRAAILAEFAGRVVPIEKIDEFVNLDTDFKTTQYRRVLKELEADGGVACVSPRQRRGTYPPGTRLRFLKIT